MRRNLGVAVAVGLVALAIPATAAAAKTAVPGELAFPATEVDAQSPTQVINVGIGAGDFGRATSIYASNCDAGGACQACPPGGFCNFKIVSTTCPAVFPAGDQSCTISVAFTPYDFASLGIEYGAVNVGSGWPTVTATGTSTLSGGGGKAKKCKKKGKAAAAKKKKCKKKRKKK